MTTMVAFTELLAVTLLGICLFSIPMTAAVVNLGRMLSMHPDAPVIAVLAGKTPTDNLAEKLSIFITPDIQKHMGALMFVMAAGVFALVWVALNFIVAALAVIGCVGAGYASAKVGDVPVQRIVKDLEERRRRYLFNEEPGLAEACDTLATCIRAIPANLIRKASGHQIEFPKAWGPEPYIAAGTLAIRKKDPETALWYFDHAVKTNGDRVVEALFLRGMAYVATGDYRLALADLHAVTTCDNNFMPAYQAIGRIYRLLWKEGHLA